jgi:hypothetical protein
MSVSSTNRLMTLRHPDQPAGGIPRWPPASSRTGDCPETSPRPEPSVSNGLGGYHFFGQEGTTPKSVGFGQVVLTVCQQLFFQELT